MCLGDGFRLKLNQDFFFFGGWCLGRKVLGTGVESLEEQFVLEHCFWKCFLSIGEERSSVHNFVPVLVLLALGSRVALTRHKAKAKLTSSGST